MKVLVTGAGGFLGEQLVRELASQNKHVFALYRSGYSKDFDQNEWITPIKGDLLKPESIFKQIGTIDRIYHVAAYSNNWAKNPEVFYHVNVGGTLRFFEVAQQHGVQKIVVTSTAGTIGPAHSDDDLVTEDQYRDINFFGDYESSKFILDERIQRLVRDGMNIVIVCPTRIFGPGKIDGKGNLISKIISKYVAGKWRVVLGDGSDQGCYAFIEDVVQGHILAMEKGKPGEKYLIGSFNITTRDIFHKIDEYTGKKVFMFNFPFFWLNLYSALIRPFAKTFNFDPVVTNDWIVKFQRNWYADTSKAQKELGFVPTPVEVAIQKTVDWIKKDIL